MSLSRTIAGFSEPETVVLAGDWHGHTRWATRMAYHGAAVHFAGAIVHTGDFGIWPGPGGVEFLDVLECALAVRDLPLFFVDGNHENFDALDAWPLQDGVHVIRPHIIHLPRGYRWGWQGHTWLALGGAISVDRNHRSPHRSWWPQESISDADVDAAIAGGPADIMITHDAPNGVDALDKYLSVNGFRLSPELQSDCDHNRQQVRRVCDAVQPKHLVHGHYHHRYQGQLHGNGYQTNITGLDCDGTSLEKNLVVLRYPGAR